MISIAERDGTRAFVRLCHPAPTCMLIDVQRLPVGDACAAALLSLNRPDQLNALDWATVRELEVVLREVDADDDVRAVLITGRGRAFSAGGDLKSYIELQQDAAGFTQFLEDIH